LLCITEILNIHGSLRKRTWTDSFDKMYWYVSICGVVLSSWKLWAPLLHAQLHVHWFRKIHVHVLHYKLAVLLRILFWVALGTGRMPHTVNHVRMNFLQFQSYRHLFLRDQRWLKENHLFTARFTNLAKWYCWLGF